MLELEKDQDVEVHIRLFRTITTTKEQSSFQPVRAIGSSILASEEQQGDLRIARGGEFSGQSFVHKDKLLTDSTQIRPNLFGFARAIGSS
jgi:hypothetical protein